MSDYEELIKNLRSVKDTWQTQEEEWMLQAADAIEKLMALTAADVAPVVHCKDCRNCYKEDEYTLWCQGRGSPAQLVPPDGFCDRGART